MSIPFTTYSKVTGQVLTTGVSPTPETYETGSVAVIQGKQYGAGWFDNGVFNSLPNRPSDFHNFNWQTKQWVDQRTPFLQWEMVRKDRDRRLAASDWRVTKAAETGIPIPSEWATYRQALRDITTQADPFNIVWPTQPV